MPVIAAATASSIAASRKRGQQEVKKDYIHREYSGCYLKVYERKGMFGRKFLGYIYKYNPSKQLIEYTSNMDDALLYCVEHGVHTDDFETSVYDYYFKNIVPSIKKYAKENNLILKDGYRLVQAKFYAEGNIIIANVFRDDNDGLGEQRYIYDVVHNFCISDVNNNGEIKFIYNYNRSNEVSKLENLKALKQNNTQQSIENTKFKHNIVAVQNGTPLGYIKSVSYSNGTFELTQNKLDAKGYTSEEFINKELKSLSDIGTKLGFQFILD